MPLIEWTRLSGEAVETTVAMLLCGVHFDATQVRPGRGDGGIDVFVPTGSDASGLSSRDVYQVKRYAENLTSSQKRKIKQSLDKVIDTAKNGSWDIAGWYLVLPLNPTPSNLEWFKKITSDLPFRCRWVGLNRIEKLASHQPQVIDYYLRDGRERLVAQTERLASVLAGRITREGGGELTPRDFLGDLQDIYRSMNQYDPHYRYEISMTAEPPSQTSEIVKPGLVAIASTGSADGWVNVSIFARSRAALEERPITGKLNVRLDPDIDSSVKLAYEKFIKFGTPVSLPPKAANVALSLPGGLGTLEDVAAQVSIGSAHPDNERENLIEEQEIILATLDPNDQPLAEVELRLVERTTGQTGGVRTVWVDKSKFINLEVLAMEPPELTVNINMSIDAAGRRPSDFVEAIELIATMHEPNRLAIADTFGPRKFSAASTTMSNGRDIDFSRTAKLARSLVTLQDVIPHRLTYPEVITADQALNILDTAKLIEGQPMKGTFHGCQVNLDEGTDLSSIPHDVDEKVELRIIRDVEIELNDQKCTVGKEMAMMRAVAAEIFPDFVRYAPIPDDTEVTRVRFDGDVSNGRVFARRL